MCGRFVLHTPRSVIARRFGIHWPVGDVRARYNVAPGTQITAVTAPAQQADEPVKVDFAWWGFRPPWADEKAPKPINARAETLARSRYFREAFAHNRCLIPANGWYEWHAAADGKRPYFIRAADDELVMFAGIYAPTGDGTDIRCAIVTEPARGPARDIHHRMPLVLAADCWNDWLSPQIEDRDTLRAHIHRLPASQLQLRPVSTRVNNINNDDETLIDAVEP